MKQFVIVASLAAVATAPGFAQDQLDFLKDLTERQHLKEMLPEYWKREAKGHLAKRRQTVAAISNEQQLAARRAYIRKTMEAAIGGFPERTPLNAKKVGEIQRDGYRIEKIIFESQPNFFVTGNLYVPTTGSGPFPAVLYPLGHERGGKSYPVWQQMLGSLAKKGFVTFAWDPLGQGERAQNYDTDFKRRKVIRSTTEHTMLGVQCILVGDNVARYTIWDGLRALDYMLSRPEVDASRVGCSGNSGGGTHTAYLSALDDRIKVAAPSCYITGWDALLDTIGPQDAEQVLLPWIGAGLDHADFIYAFAPKPYLMLSAVRDFFSISGARSMFREMQDLYGRLDQQVHMSMSEVDLGHGYHKGNRLAAYDWFARWLKGSEDKSPEPEVVIAEFEELQCTPTGQVATSLGGETVFTLNRKRADALDAKLPAVGGKGDLAAYQKDIRERVRELSGIQYKPGRIEVKPYGTITRTGYKIEKFVYESEPGITIPSLLYLPDGGPARKPAIVYVNGRGKSADGAAGGEIEWFVKQGSAVLAIDIRGQGETSTIDERNGSDFPRYFGQYDATMMAFLVGRSLVGPRAMDILRGVDVLAARADVDAQRISGIGKGGGAVSMLYAAALDDRLKKVAFEDMLSSYRAVVDHQIHQNIFEDVVMGALKAYDLPDLVASLSPREVLLVDPNDPLGLPWPMEAAKGAYDRPAKIYQATGASGSLKVERRRIDAGPETVFADWLSAR